jgi:tetratricopeptide (TPR) repeat protein
MRSYLFFLCLSLTICHSLKGQGDCVLEVGDYCIQKSKTINFRSRPEVSDNVLKVIDNDKNNFGFYLIDDKIVNGFVQVRIWDFSVPDEENNNILLPDRIGWVAFSLVEFLQEIHLFMEGSNSTVYDDDINTMENLKLENRCTYSKQRHASSFYGRAKERLREKNYKGAISDFSQAIELLDKIDFGLQLRAITYRAYAKYSGDNYYGAIDDFNKVVENYSKIPSYLLYDMKNMKLINILFFRGSCYFMIGNYSKALTEMNQVISMDQQYGSAYFIRGQVKDYLNNKEGCCRDLSKAFDLGCDQAYEEISKRCKN